MEDIAELASTVYQRAEERWFTQNNSECTIESTDIFDVLFDYGIECTEENEQIMENALNQQGFYKKASERYLASLN